MKDGGLNVVLFFVGVTALFLWYRKTIAASTDVALAPPSAGVKTDAAGGFGLGLADGICSLPGAKYVDFTGQCSKLSNPAYRQGVANSYSKVLSTKTPIGGIAKENLLAVANPINWFAGPKGANWRNGTRATNQTATDVSPTGTPWKTIAVAPSPPGGKPPATNAWKPAAPSSNSKPTNAWGR